MAIIIASTMSDSGKSTVTTAIVKLLDLTPMKIQNMSLNSFPTMDNGEIAFIQAYQAFAKGIEPERYMNPILLKPAGKGIEVIYFGTPIGVYSAEEYYNKIEELWWKIKDYIRRDVVIESAGGIEPNFIDKDLTLVRLVKEFNLPVILILDIDRGGAFTSAYGAYLTLPESVRRNLKGFIINKFRGDEKLLNPAIKWLEEKTGMRYLGYLPYFDEPPIMQEDSMNIFEFGEGDIEVGILAYPYMSNFNEFYAFNKSNAHIKFIKKPSQLSKVDLVIIPGSRNTFESLVWLTEKGFIEHIRKKPVLGICGGFQLMGKKLIDSYGYESGSIKEYQGLGIFDIEVIYDKDKIISRSWSDIKVNGYEIRRGKIKYLNEKPILTITKRGYKEVNVYDGAIKDDKLGYSIHGSLFSDGGKKLLYELYGIKVNSKSLEEEIKDQSERLANIFKRYIDVDLLNQINV
ncbi:cobyric acid synthase [Sulfurisphaera tokodaii]|uniref:Probable cobyric acid synthase n=2 Tax=Sulfurisphaera tokodaii TaxID=111955 RepID=F9VPE1_SULTO|nr:cobyric acid synthase [Sulfurisphaera tokodaii]BAK54788.1 cobyric acid synthase [Sulfurisphaera tokodaii str. 7]HII75164.1 cobyric acid synthase [Sulfurisphaera tokodaii]